MPDLDFRLHAGDVITVTIDQVGELSNPVVVGKEHFGFLTTP